MSNYIKTTKEEIYNYWFSRIDKSGFNVDESEALERCWRCGCKRSLERCHIIPRSLGGEDVPENYVLLCKRCHLENPNVNDPEIMWDWIKAYREPLDEMFWINRGLKEYEKIYKTTFQKDISKYEGFVNPAEAKQLVKYEMLNSASHHFGDPYMNSATLAGIMRIIYKKFKYKYGEM